MPKKKTSREQTNRGRIALDALEMSTTTQADKKRIAVLWQALRALDDEQSDVKAVVQTAWSTFREGPRTPVDLQELMEALRLTFKEDVEACAALLHEDFRDVFKALVDR